MGGQVLTLNFAVVLAVIIWVRLRRRTEARSRTDEFMTVVIVAAFGVLIAPTPLGHWCFQVITSVVTSLSNTHL